MQIGRWLRDHPRFLEKTYQISHWLIKQLQPLIAKIGYKRTDRLMRSGEAWSKRLIFNCRMCGQCVLHSTGMTCPMTCPKNLRNGPCGGVRGNGNCEVISDMRCIWVEAFERSQKMTTYGDEMLLIQPPVNRLLEGSSAWINLLTAEDIDVPLAWAEMPVIPLAEK